MATAKAVLETHNQKIGENKLVFPLLLLSFFLSGAAALTAEFVWLRMLTTSLGSSSASLNAILIAFMGGLSVGASLTKSLAPRLKKPLYAYIVIELFLAVYLAASPQIIEFANHAVIFFLPGIDSESLRYAFRLLAATLAVGPATIAMGVTTPLVIASVVAHADRAAYGAGLFYGVNTFGGMCGALIAGCYLFLEFGITSTLQMAAGLNVLAALLSLPGCWWIRAVDAPPRDRNVASVRPGVSKIMILAFAGGFCGMALEIIFARFLLFTVGGSYFSHTIILSGFLGGIFIGSLILGFLSAKRGVSQKDVPVLFSLFGFSILGSALLYPVITSFIQSSLVEHHWFSLSPLTIKFLAAFLVTLLPAAVSGMILPMLAGIASMARNEVGFPVSRIFAWNTLGAVVSVCLTGSLIINFLGVLRAAFAISLLLFMMTVFAGTRTGIKSHLPGLVGIIVCVLALLFAPRHPLIIHAAIYERLGKPAVIHYGEDENTSVSILDFPKEKVRALMTNGLEEARNSAVPDRDDNGWLSDITLLSHPSAHSIFASGLGGGQTAGAAGLYPNLKVTVVEISPAVIEALPFLDPFAFYASRNPSIRLLRGDARNYLLMTPDRFDLINSDVFISALTGTSNLYNKEYFEICRNRIKQDGRVVIPVNLDLRIGRVVAKTFCAAFPYVKAVYVPVLRYYFLIGGKQEIDLNHPIPDDWRKNRVLMDRFQFLNVSTEQGLAGFPGLSRQKLVEQLRGVPVCTDDRPVIDFMVGPTRDDPFVW